MSLMGGRRVRPSAWVSTELGGIRRIRFTDKNPMRGDKDPACLLDFGMHLAVLALSNPAFRARDAKAQGNKTYFHHML